LRDIVKYFTTAVLCLLLLPQKGSGKTIAFDDSITLKQFYTHILNYHPLVKQANLLPDAARSEITMARGMFDPSVSFTYEEKEFKDENYFRYFQPSIKIPTWIGVDIKAGYDRNTGQFADGDEFTPNAGLLYAGLSVPILDGLIIDERRNTLRQAKLFRNIAEQEQIKVLNKILLQAAKDFWQWQQSYQKLKFITEGFNLAQQRFTFVRSNVLLGEAAGIDSIEAKIEVQKRQAMLLEAELEFKNSAILVSNYLWDNKQQPLELKKGVYPSEEGNEITTISAEELKVMADNANTLHPEIRKQEFKIQQLKIERLYRRQALLPTLNFEFHPLLNAPFDENELNVGHYENNYKMGISFYTPLFLRKERGKLSLTNIKLKQTEFSLQQNRRDIVNQVYTSYNEMTNLAQMLTVQIEMVKNTRLMRNGEQTRFENGESSLFLINRRERSLIEAQVKLAELKGKYAKAKAILEWSTGKPMF
jgi:outer membrane protein TolC